MEREFRRQQISSRGIPDYLRDAVQAVSLTKGAYEAFKGGYKMALKQNSKNKILSNDKMAYQKKKSTMPRKTRKGRSSKSQTKKSQSVTALSKRVASLSKSVKSDQAYHTHKWVNTYSQTSSVGQCSHVEYTMPVSSIETLIANLRYYNPSVPGTLTTANPSTGTYSRQVHVKNINHSIELFNNYQVPAFVRAYLVKPKGDTGIAPLTYYANGITDQVITGGNATTERLYLTDINVFKEQFSCKLLKAKYMPPGSYMSVSYNTGEFDYDPALYDEHTLAYQAKYKNHAIIIRIQGFVGHDSVVTTEHNMLACGVDVQQSFVAKIVYDAGVNLDDIYVTDSRDSAFTNGGLISSKPVADNIGYSLA